MKNTINLIQGTSFDKKHIKIAMNLSLPLKGVESDVFSLLCSFFYFLSKIILACIAFKTGDLIIISGFVDDRNSRRPF